MKSKKEKALRLKLFATIKKVLQQDEKGELSDRSEKSLRKAIKRMVKKTTGRKESLLLKPGKKKLLLSRKFKLDGVKV